MGCNVGRYRYMQELQRQQLLQTLGYHEILQVYLQDVFWNLLKGNISKRPVFGC
jgi:hypothetical protein